jgi:hypothetical protein
VYVDDDDLAQADIATKLGAGVRTGPRTVLSDCWNHCYELAKGDILMQANDDIVFRTPGWDRQVEAAFEACPDRILMVYGNDNCIQFEKFGPHPFLHRRWVEAVGYFTPPYFVSDFGDTWINDVANALRRRRYLPFIVEHMHFINGKAAQDENTLDRLRRHQEHNPTQLYQQLADSRRQDVEKLQALLNTEYACAV